MWKGNKIAEIVLEFRIQQSIKTYKKEKFSSIKFHFYPLLFSISKFRFGAAKFDLLDFAALEFEVRNSGVQGNPIRMPEFRCFEF